MKHYNKIKNSGVCSWVLENLHDSFNSKHTLEFPNNNFALLTVISVLPLCYRMPVIQ